MYKSLTKTKKNTQSLKPMKHLKSGSTNAIIKYYKSSSLITVKRHAMVPNFFES